MHTLASRHRSVKGAPPRVGWLMRPHLPCLSQPCVAGILVVTVDGCDRFFDVCSVGPDFHSGQVTKIRGWRVSEKVRGASVSTICFRPGQESDGGFEFVELLRKALETADLPLYTPRPSAYRSEAEAAASDPAIYEEHIDALAESEWPGK